MYLGVTSALKLLLFRLFDLRILKFLDAELALNSLALSLGFKGVALSNLCRRVSSYPIDKLRGQYASAHPLHVVQHT